MVGYCSTEEEEWTWWEKLVILYKIIRGTEHGNSNPALWRIYRSWWLLSLELKMRESVRSGQSGRARMLGLKKNSER